MTDITITNNPVNYQEAQDVVFIDAYNLIYRAFHGNQSKLKNAEGLPTNALYTVTSMLLKLRDQFTNIAHCVAVFDGGGNFRTELDSEYKANRKPMPDDLQLQMPYMKQLFTLLGWPVMQAEGVEADDVIGSLALRSAAKGFNTYIVSSDKDFRQIVSTNLNVIDSMAGVCYDPAQVKEKMGVGPENVVAWLALVGDSSDNVAGVDKFGPKTATKYLTQYENIENLIAHQDEIPGVAGENLRAAIACGQLAKSLELVTLKTDLDIKITRKDVTIQEIQQEAFVLFCDKMGFRSFSRKIKP